jgi:hypothetical protein
LGDAPRPSSGPKDPLRIASGVDAVRAAALGRVVRLTRRHVLAAAGLVTAATVVGAGGAGLVYQAWWDQPADATKKHLSTDEIAFLDALADAMFPPNSGLPKRGREARVAQYVDLVLGAMEPSQSKLVRLSLHALDEYPRISTGSAFRDLEPEAGVEVLQGWVRHPLAEVRGLIASLYIFVAMAWSLHPEVSPTFAAQFKCGYGA